MAKVCSLRPRSIVAQRRSPFRNGHEERLAAEESRDVVQRETIETKASVQPSGKRERRGPSTRTSRRCRSSLRHPVRRCPPSSNRTSIQLRSASGTAWSPWPITTVSFPRLDRATPPNAPCHDPSCTSRSTKCATRTSLVRRSVHSGPSHRRQWRRHRRSFLPRLRSTRRPYSQSKRTSNAESAT